MAEEIRPSREVARGFISTSRPGRSVLDSLATALDTVSDASLAAVEGAAALELEETTELLSSPLITQEEVNEIEADTNFPITRMKAENRRGALRGEEQRESLEQELAKAVNAVDTRRILRQHQQQLLESAKSAGEQAGIREYFGETAPRLLAEAAKRRQERAVAEEREVVNSTLLNASRKGTDHMFTVASGIVLEESIDFNGDITQNHQDIVANALGRYAENEHSAADMIGFLQKMLKEDGLVRPRDRMLYNKAIKTLQTDAASGDVQLTYAQRKAAAKKAVQQEALSEIRRGPRGTLSDTTIARVRNAFDDPLEAERWILEAQIFEGKPSVVGSAAYDEALEAVKNATKGPLGLIDGPERISTFRRLAGALAPRILDEEDQGRATLLSLVDETARLHDEENQLLTNVEAVVAENRRNFLSAAIEAKKAGDLKKAKLLRDRALDPVRAGSASPLVLKRRAVQRALFIKAEELGFDIQDDLINLLE